MVPHQACIACQGLWHAHFDVLLPDAPLEVELTEFMGHGAPRCRILIREGGPTMTEDEREGLVLSPDGARRLLEGREDLTDDERALLLALASVDAEVGGSLDEKERAALDELKAQMEGYDADELAQAVQHMVTAKSRKGRRLKWPKLKRGRDKRSTDG